MSLDFDVPLSAQNVTIPALYKGRGSTSVPCTQSIYNLTAPEHASNDVLTDKP